MGRRFLVAFLSLLVLAVPASAKPAAKASARTDWTHVVAATPAGGFMLGNPKAKVKLVETMDTVRQSSDLSMGWCVRCHKDHREVEGRTVAPSTDCAACHY